MASRPTAFPGSLGAGGKRLWKQLLQQDVSLEEADNPMRALAQAAARTQDRCDELHELCAVEDVTIENEKTGNVMINPIYAEARQQEASLARLLTSLRLPDEATGKKPQSRPARGAQPARGVSSLDRARAAKHA